jgi:hypothetical protein
MSLQRQWQLTFQERVGSHLHLDGSLLSFVLLVFVALLGTAGLEPPRKKPKTRGEEQCKKLVGMTGRINESVERTTIVCI